MSYLYNIEDALMSIAFRQWFFIITIALLILLFIVKYKVLPHTIPQGYRGRPVSLTIVNWFIAAIMILMVLAAFAFWLRGNG